MVLCCKNPYMRSWVRKKKRRILERQEIMVGFFRDISVFCCVVLSIWISINMAFYDISQFERLSITPLTFVGLFLVSFFHSWNPVSYLCEEKWDIFQSTMGVELLEYWFLFAISYKFSPCLPSRFCIGKLV